MKLLYFVPNIFVLTTLICIKTSYASGVKHALDQYALNVAYDDTSLMYEELDINGDGLLDIMITSNRPNSSNGRGLYYWSLYLNQGDHYSSVKGEGLSLTSFDVVFIHELNKPAIRTYISGGGRQGISLVYYLGATGELESTEVALVKFELTDKGLVAKESLVNSYTFEPLERKGYPFTPVENLVTEETYQKIKAKKRPWTDLYFTSMDPENPNSNLSRLHDIKTRAVVGSYNSHTGERIFNDDFNPDATVDSKPSKKNINGASENNKTPPLARTSSIETIKGDKPSMSSNNRQRAMMIVGALALLLIVGLLIFFRKQKK